MTTTIRSVRVGDTTLSIAEAGQGGRPLLMVHGFSGAKEDFADWFDQLAERGWHVVAPDLRGHGASDHPPRTADYSLALFEADLLALVDDLRWDRFVLVGHSMGGMVAQSIAIHHADRLDGLVLMDTSPSGISSRGGRAFVATFKAVVRVVGLKPLARVMRKPPPRSPESVRRVFADRPGFVEWNQAKIAATSPEMARSMMGELSNRPDHVPQLSQLNLPVLVIVGEHDIPGFLTESQRMADAIVGSTLVALPGAAHNPQIETPELWWAALTKFLDALAADPRLAPSAAELTTDEQATLTAGADMWHTAGVDRLGVAGIGVTDGPSGARGTKFTGDTSASLPCGAALASTWNRELIGRVGRLLGDEARSKGASVLLAPTVNIQRHPLGGRGFECYSEDPYLTAEIAVAFIKGVQSRGVGCAVKHFAFNDQETERMSIDVKVDERTRREIYLPPFEAAVRNAGVWSVMAAYNRVDGQFCSEHKGLLTDLLRDEWGFDGLVMSDWFGTHGLAALTSGLDLEMPGPPTALGQLLVAALEAGDVKAEDVKRAAQRVLDLIDRTASAQREVTDTTSAATTIDIARTAATESIVLLANNGVLPLASSGQQIALLGWRAGQPEFQGGGSAQVTPAYVITPLQGITDRAGEGTVVFEAGRPTPRSRPIGGSWLAATNESDVAPKVRLDYFTAGDLHGDPLHTDTSPETTAVWLGAPAEGVPAGDFSARLTARFAPDATGPWTLAISGAGVARLFLDGKLLCDTTGAAPGTEFFGLFTAPVEVEVELDRNTAYDLVAEVDVSAGESAIPLSGVTLQARPPTQPDAVGRAVRAAAAADVAVLVVGHDERETEGKDNTTMDLPADQVELIGQVAAVNPRTVIVVNAASPVTMDWADEVAAIVQMSYLGQEAGNALAAVLFGDADASGRLTATHPRQLSDSPAHLHFPGKDGVVEYAEGIFVGYRHYDTHGVNPRWCFGHGLSYTTFAYSPLTVDASRGQDGGPVVQVSVDVTNTGARAGHEVVQVYVRAVDSPVERPDRELKGFEKVHLQPGETTTVAVTLDQRAFAHWDGDLHGWSAAPGTYEFLVGSSSRAIHSTAAWTLTE